MRRKLNVKFRLLFAATLGGAAMCCVLAAERSLASDCPPGGYADCKSAAQTAENPLIPLIGAGIGAVAAGGDVKKVIKDLLNGGGSDSADPEPESEKEKQPKSNEPCQDQKNAMTASSQAAKMLHDQIGTMRDLKNSLDAT